MRGVYRSTVIGSPRVGISLFHTVGDRDRAVEQINTEFRQFAGELFSLMGVDLRVYDATTVPTDPTVFQAWKARLDANEAKMHASPIWPIWHNVFSPVYTEWEHFYRNQSSWNEFFTSWDEYEHWQDRIKQLRETIDRELKPLDARLLAPPPEDLQKTIWAEGGEAVAHGAKKIASGIGDTFTMVKVAVYGGLAVAGLFVLAKLASDLKGNRDPAQSYLNAYQARGMKMLPAPQ